MKIPLARTYFYQGELLTLTDFVRDQQYFRDVNALQNQHLYTPGVASGMTLAATGNVLRVEPGLAYDCEGTPLASAKAMIRDVTADTLPAGTYPVGVSYSDSIMTSQGTQSLQGSHRIDEQPVLVVIQAKLPAKPVVKLGSVTIGPDGKITATTNAEREIVQLQIAANAPSPPPEHLPTTLRIGQVLTGSGVPGDAPLTVGLDIAANPDSQGVARFGFTKGDDMSGVVSLGPGGTKDADGMITVVYKGQRVWSVDHAGTTFSAGGGDDQANTPLQKSLDVIKALRGVTFTPVGGEAPRVGLIAQTVTEALPEAVHADASGHPAIAYNAIVSVLVEAVKTLAQRVDALDAAQAHQGVPLRDTPS